MQQFAAQHSVQYVAAYIVLFAASWIGGTFLISRLSGWGRPRQSIPHRTRSPAAPAMAAERTDACGHRLQQHPQARVRRGRALSAHPVAVRDRPSAPVRSVDGDSRRGAEALAIRHGANAAARAGCNSVPAARAACAVSAGVPPKRTAAPTRRNEMGHMKPAQTVKPGSVAGLHCAKQIDTA